MNDDWRLRVDVHEDGIAHKLAERLDASELEHKLEASFQDRVIVSVEGSELFLYAATREQAQSAEQLIRAHADAQGWKLESELKHWHPSAEEWEDPDKPLPTSDAARAAERAALMAKERRESGERGFPGYEVRIACPSPEQTRELSANLREQGLPNVQRWNFLLIGALDEDSARELADRVRGEVPAGSIVTIQATAPAVLADQPGNPFAIFGGLAG